MPNWKRTRPIDNPYLIINRGDWEWRILKSHNNDVTKPYARAFCAVKSPYTYGGWEYGDTYWEDIPNAINVVLAEF